MFEVFTHGITVLNCLSILAFITTVGLFFCGIPICRQIWKRGDTKEISGAPFLMGVVGGSCWFAYGYLKKDYTVLYVTGTQILLYSTYSIFYWCMTKKKVSRERAKWKTLFISLKVAAVIGISSALAAGVYFFDHKIFHPLGFVCMTLNAADFAAPLAGIKVVIRRRATSTLPLPLCIANFLVSSEWFVYGLLVHDFYLITPNGIGCFFATCQILLFAVLPRKPGMRPPVVRAFRWMRSACCGGVVDGGVDAEDAKVVEDGVDGDAAKRTSSLSRAHRWSKRVIANMAGEIESVATKVGIHDQFGYSGKLNRVEETDSSPAETPLDTHDARLAGWMARVSAQEMAARLGASCRQSSRQPRTPFLKEATPPVRRVASTPNLSE